MPKRAEVLLVANSFDWAKTYTRLIGKQGHHVEVVNTLDQTIESLSNRRFNAVVLDKVIGDQNGLAAQVVVEAVRRGPPGTTLIQICDIAPEHESKGIIDLEIRSASQLGTIITKFT